MKRKKILMKFIACILTFAMVAGIIPVPDMRGGEKKLGVVEVKASTNSHTKEDAVNWAISQIGKSLDYDKIYGEQCVDLIKYYYDYLGNASYAKGYANEYQWNELPGGWERVYENYAIGDVAVWKPNYGYTGENGHVGIIVGGDYDYVYVVNQNYAGKNYCTEEHVPWDYIACAIRPDFVSKVSTTGIVLNKNSISLSSEGATSQLTATVSPSNATDKSVIWSSGNTGVATVDGDGKVTAVFPGTTTITAKNSGGQTATCTVTVNYNDGWTYSTSLPSNVTTANGYEIQYKNTVATTTTVWVPGEVEAFPKPQATSDYYRYRGYYYYHWCSTGINVNFYQNSTYVHYDAIDPSLVYVVGEYADTEDASIIYYKLNWNDGTLAYCNSNSTCDGSNGTHGNRSYYWYRGYEYQKYSTKTETTYTTSSWVTTKDANATTVQYRYKVIPPTGVSLNATSKTFTAKNATYQLTATVTPSNAKDKTVTWKSSNTSVATVDTTGKVTAVG
ncbi:MAG: Ig-like domain-containing protein, partial [Lachnospiraceae bacterium]